MKYFCTLWWAKWSSDIFSTSDSDMYALLSTLCNIIWLFSFKGNSWSWEPKPIYVPVSIALKLFTPNAPMLRIKPKMSRCRRQFLLAGLAIVYLIFVYAYRDEERKSCKQIEGYKSTSVITFYMLFMFLHFVTSKSNSYDFRLI